MKVAQRALNVYPDGIFGALTFEAAKEYQRAHGLVDDGIIGAKTWALLLKEDTTGATAAVSMPNIKKSKRSITEIIVHCTATPEGRNCSLEDIKRYHVAPPPQGRGWSDIGYHYLVLLDGTIKNGRDVDYSGAHTTNHNSHSIGVCYVGGTTKNDINVPKDTRTYAQKNSLIELLKRLRKLYPTAKIYGHRNFAAKACPSFDAKEEYKNI